jgi:hypothetical protein
MNLWVQGVVVSASLMASGPEGLSKSEQEAVQAVALKHYLGQHPPSGGAPLCLAVSGHQAPTKELRALLRGIRLDTDKNCHFREGGLVYSATRVALNPDGVAELEISKLEFGDISSPIERLTYRVKKGPNWQVVSAEQKVQ